MSPSFDSRLSSVETIISKLDKSLDTFIKLSLEQSEKHHEAVRTLAENHHKAFKELAENHHKEILDQEKRIGTMYTKIKEVGINVKIQWGVIIFIATCILGYAIKLAFEYFERGGVQ